MENKAGVTQCNVCKSHFTLTVGQHYVSREGSETGITTVIKKNEERLYDTFDCPHCGCQNRVQERMRTLVTTGIEEPTTEESESSESENGQQLELDDDEDDWPFEED